MHVLVCECVWCVWCKVFLFFHRVVAFIVVVIIVHLRFFFADVFLFFCYSCDSFEKTNQTKVFDFCKLRIVHGWLVDPSIQVCVIAKKAEEVRRGRSQNKRNT